jgi:hypothetical protein
VTALAGLCLLAGLACLGLHDRTYLTYDAAQFLSMTESILEGRGASTRIIFYDHQHATGRVPTPQTNFPPGLAALVAGLGGLGLRPAPALFLVCVLAFVLVPLALRGALRAAGLSPGQSSGLAAAWFLFPVAWANVLGSYSDVPFVAATVGGFWALLRSRNARSECAWLLLAGVLAGAALLVRYAGLFFILLTAAWSALRFLRRPTSEAARAAFCLNAPSLLTGAWLYLRNLAVVGTAEGMTILVVRRPAGEAVRHVVWALQDFAGLSLSGLLRLRINEVLGLAALAVLAVLGLRALARDRRVGTRLRIPGAGLAAAYVLLTLAAFVYWAFNTSTFTLLDRYLLPLVPFGLFLAGATCRAVLSDGEFPVPRRRLAAGAGLLVLLAGQGGTLEAQARGLIRHSLRFRVAELALRERLDGHTVESLLRRSVSDRHPLLSMEPQLVGALLGRPVVGLTTEPWTTRVWTQAEVLRTIGRYDVCYVLVLPRTNGIIPRYANLPAMNEILDKTDPPWLEMRHSSPAVQLYATGRCGDEAAQRGSPPGVVPPRVPRGAGPAGRGQGESR